MFLTTRSGCKQNSLSQSNQRKSLPDVHITNLVLQTEHNVFDTCDKDGLWKSLYFGMNEGVCFNEVIYDKSGEAVDFRIFDVNPAYETLLGLKKDQVVGSLGSELYGTDGMAFLDMYKKVLDSGKRIAYEFYWPITAKYFNISVFCSVKDLFAVFFMDITGQREAQRKEREKFELQLKQAQKMEAIGTLAGGIAHDFNNILMPIILQTELALLEINDNNILCSRLQKILEASLRARDLVKQILTFSRQDERQAIPLNMTTIIKEAVKLLRPTLPRTIEIRLNLESSSDMVMADPTQIHQVLINLCTNAAHAMRNKDSSVLDIGLRNVEIDVKTAAEHPDLKPGSYVRMTVSDTGHGIDPSVINRIFDPFFTTKTRGEGTGMGLSVVHSIVRSCGGAITVKSKPGKGSVFHVYFPQFEGKASITTESVQALPVGNERILVVDDEKPMVDSLAQMLDRLGYKVTARTSSIEALEAFRARPEAFDLIITDQTMPNMTGEHLAQEILGIRPDVPVILCTGFSEAISEDTAKEMGIRAFLMKPIIMEKMARVVRQVLDG